MTKEEKFKQKVLNALLNGDYVKINVGLFQEKSAYCPKCNIVKRFVGKEEKFCSKCGTQLVEVQIED